MNRSLIFLPKHLNFYFLLAIFLLAQDLGAAITFSQISDLWSNASCCYFMNYLKNLDVLCPSSPLSWHFSNTCPSHILLMTALFFLMTSSWHYLCRSTKWLPAKLCLQPCSKCVTHSCILTQTVKVISYPPLQHPAKLPWHRLVHFSLCSTPLLIPALTAHSSLCPCLSCLSASFHGTYCTSACFGQRFLF